MLGSLVTLALMAQSHAAGCDAKALQKQLTDAAPQQVPEVYISLATCDANAARGVTAATLPRMVSGDQANAAAVAAIKAGAGKEVRAWIDGLMSDERGAVLGALGGACTNTKEVQTFFLDTAAATGDEFWTKRWFRPLAECRAPDIQNFLVKEFGVITTATMRDQTRFLGIVEVTARNLGGGAVPMLKDLLAKTTDDERQSYVVNAFSDAAGVGSVAGMDSKAAEAGVAAIVGLADTLGVKAVDQARTTLRALGDERASDEMAGFRYKTVKQADGNLLYGVVVFETATCKNGKTSQMMHVAEVLDPGQTWPDQLLAKVESSAKTGWKLDLAEKCKGEGKLDFKVTGEPMADAKALKKWTDEQLEIAGKTAVDKRARMDHDPIKL